ncbi:MAG: hypothetical protein U0T83_02615 [Bacteriovoracaceae bacterium]
MKIVIASTIALAISLNGMADSTENNFLGSLSSGTVKAERAINLTSDSKVVLQWGRVINPNDYTLDQLSCELSTLNKKVSIQKDEQLILTRLKNYETSPSYQLDSGKSLNIYSYTYLLTSKKQKLLLTCQTTQTSTTVKNLQETVWEALKLQTTNFSKN